MNIRKRLAPRKAGVLGFAALALLAGCASDLVTVAPAPPAQYQRLGQAKGNACGMLGFLATAYHFAPLGLNSRMQRAYANALASVPGATALVDVTVEEEWFWPVAGTVRCVTITGEAVK